jgi:hypothetical protein
VKINRLNRSASIIASIAKTLHRPVEELLTLLVIPRWSSASNDETVPGMRTTHVDLSQTGFVLALDLVFPKIGRFGHSYRGQLEDSGFGAANSYRSILIDRVWPMSSVLGGYAGHPGQIAR